MSMMKEFKEFAVKGNVIDLAVGVVIGGAFGAIVKSLVDDVIMPPIGLLIGNVDFSQLFIVLKEGAAVHGPYLTVEAAKLLLAVLVWQIALGIATLLLAVPVALGAAHQGGAMIVFGVLLWLNHELRVAPATAGASR